MPGGYSYDEAVAARFDREQADLETLCAERPLVTSELLAANDYYGNATILKCYAGVQQGSSIKAVVPHGVFFSDTMWPMEQQVALPAVLVYPPWRAGVYRANAGMVPVRSAAPFVYAERLVPYDGPRHGTLYFPSHSTYRITVTMDFAQAADELLDWPESMRPVTIMAYWRDVQLGHHLPFLERGFEVVSAGHIRDRDFVLRLAHLLKKHRHAAGNAVGSHLFYAVQSGCTFHLLDQEHGITGSPQALLGDVDPLLSPSSQQKYNELVRLFSTMSPEVDSQQRDIVDNYLGTRFALTPDGLADTIAWLDRLDRWGGIAQMVGGIGPRDAESAGLRALVPCSMRRPLTCATSRIEGVVRLLVSKAIAAARRIARRAVRRIRHAARS